MSKRARMSDQQERVFDCFMKCKGAMCDVWDDCLCASHEKCKIQWGCAEHNISSEDEED
jgi:hypothetical protein